MSKRIHHVLRSPSPPHMHVCMTHVQYGMGGVGVVPSIGGTLCEEAPKVAHVCNCTQ